MIDWQANITVTELQFTKDFTNLRAIGKSYKQNNVSKEDFPWHALSMCAEDDKTRD